MAYAINIPNYNRHVLTSGWEKRELIYPLDCMSDKTGPAHRAHYRTFGYDPCKSNIPRTTTQELQEDGFKKCKLTTRGLRKAMVNFTSYPVIDPKNMPMVALKPHNKVPDISIKKTSFTNPCPQGVRTPLMMFNSHPFLNCKPKTEFTATGNELCPNKFMDDEQEGQTETNELMNYVKKHRSISFDPMLGEYTHIIKRNNNYGKISFGIYDEETTKK